ncbi:hypothetical protein SBDP1_1640017 [Syntrophobacter sp. SbD1]|nr:hypothetical protein SBDP1_1640017 [Syntrophobacter sp. SbD1]
MVQENIRDEGAVAKPLAKEEFFAHEKHGQENIIKSYRIHSVDCCRFGMRRPARQGRCCSRTFAG